MFFERLNNLKIKYKLMFVFIPLILLCTFLSSKIIVSEWAKYDAAQTRQKAHNFFSLITGLVYELQIERGMVSTYLNSGAQKFSKELASQRELVNKKIKLLHQYQNNNALDVKLGHQKYQLGEILNSLNNRKNILTSADEQEKISNSTNYNTEEITKLIYFTERVGRSVGSESTEAFNTLLWLQEYAGQERAMVSAIFASGKINIRAIQVEQGLIAKQDSLMSRFRHMEITQQQMQLLNAYMNDSSVKQVRIMRKALFDESAKTNTISIDVADWFRYSTSRIAVIKKMNDEISREIIINAKKTTNTKRIEFLSIGLFTAGLLTLSFILVVVITRRLAFGVVRVSGALKQVAETGDFNVHVEVQGSDEIGGMALSFNNLINEQKRVEEELRKSQEYLVTAKVEAENANKEKSAFLARMSHELRTPMNAILGFGQLLEKDKSLQVEQKEHVQFIINAGHHLLELINDVLDLARIETGNIKIKLEVVDCDQIIKETIELIEPMAEKRYISLLYDRPQNVDNMLLADPTRLKEVMLNLLSNAVKYNHKNGMITICLKQVSDGRVRINVTDTGDGLSGDQLLHLFQSFDRLGAENTEIEGTGIGLVISRHIVEMMGGEMGVESAVNMGSTFWFELNTQVNMVDMSLFQSDVNMEPNQIYVEADNCTVLYIEDNPANMRLVEHIINKFSNITFMAAMTAEQGLEMASTYKPDLILLDINLPDMDGFEVLEQLQSMGLTQDSNVVAISANTMPLDIKKGMDAGFKDYLTKPINLTNFINKLPDLLGSRKIRTLSS